MNDPRIPWIAARQSGQDVPSPLDIFLSGLATQQGQRQGAPGMTPLQQEQVAQSRALFPERQRQAELETDTQAAQLGGARANEQSANLKMYQDSIDLAVQMAQGITPENYAVRRAAIVQLYPDAAQTLGETYDPRAVKALVQEGLSGVQFFQNGRDLIDHAMSGEYLTGLAKLFASVPTDATPQAQESYWQAAVQFAEASGVPKEALDLYAPAVPEGMLRGAIPQRRYSPAFVERAKAALQVGQQAGTTKTPAAEKPPNVGSFEDYVLRMAKEAGKTPEQLTPADIERARKQYQQADDRAPRVSVTVPGGGSGSDAVAIAEAIIRGDQPPTTQGLYRFGAPVRAELAKRGYDLSTAQRDWAGTIKAVQQLNGAQQVRMRQAIAKTYHSLDLVDELVLQWQGGKFPALNRARLLAAKQGALGPEAQKIATLLDQQINDVVGEMANVLMGGNSPTDRGLELASHNMKAEWSQGTLTAAVNQARRNLKLAQQAMFETVPAGTSPNNQYWEGAAGTREGAAPPVTRKRYNRATKAIEQSTDGGKTWTVIRKLQ